MKSPVVWFLGFFICIGLVMLVFAVYGSIRSIHASRWPAVAARLLSAELETDFGKNGRVSYRVRVRYEYGVDGIVYSGDRVAFGYHGSSERGRHRAILNKLKAAENLQVRYSPSNPSVSTLSAGFHEFHQSSFAFAALWLSLLILAASIAWRFTTPAEALRHNLITR